MSQATLGFVEFHFKAAAHKPLGLSNIGYPVPASHIPELAAGGDLPYELLIFWLQNHIADPGVDWCKFEPAVTALLDRITPDDHRPNVTVETDKWCLEIRPVALDYEVVNTTNFGEYLGGIYWMVYVRRGLCILAPLVAVLVGRKMQCFQK